METIWKVIKGFEDYQISNAGEVLSFKRNKNGIKMKPKIDKDGYFEIGIRDTNGKRVYFRIHRLVAKAFIDNPNNLPVVNHKDGNKQNNHASNLEWVTVAENTKHVFDVLGRKGQNGGNNKIVAKIDAENNCLLKIYNSIKDASEDVGVTIQAISNCLNGKNRTSGGFKWEFVDKGVTTIETTSK
ncbi:MULTISPECIES: NUMOD4 domain-containing protein [Bacillus]|uniref:NUMOD4 domain-containing protein n=1 Tax=Bacillus TaxID=1386 RepID=UPI0015823010|nr:MULTISPECIES: NUMOD4 domain-containing protein [Bacillus]GIN67115.1 endonuclease [Bacillus sonorensis]